MAGKKIQITLQPEVLKKLEQVSKSLGITKSAAIAICIEAYKKQETK